MSFKFWITSRLKRRSFSPPPVNNWPHETWPTENGGHTYCGFASDSHGVVTPDVPFNFRLIDPRFKKELIKGFEDMGYQFDPRLPEGESDV